jgi:hypothetical protein
LLRIGSGTVSLGGASGAHGLEVTTPASTVNRPEVMGGATGTPGRTGWRAAGSDANISAVMQPKGSGALLARLMRGDGGLLCWLRSVTHFFLLDQGDLTDVTLHYVRGKATTEVRVGGVNQKDAAAVAAGRLSAEETARIDGAKPGPWLEPLLDSAGLRYAAQS